MDSRSSPSIHKCGTIKLIISPMFSGKTTELLRRIKRYRIAKQYCVLIKYVKDIRPELNSSTGMIGTHDRDTMQCDIATASLEDVLKFLHNYPMIQQARVIGIDEGQFLPGLVEFCEEMARLGKTVIVSALSSTFERKSFDRVSDLIAKADSIDHMTAICTECYEPAAFSKRMTKETATEVIGGADKYSARCRQCFSRV